MNGLPKVLALVQSDVACYAALCRVGEEKSLIYCVSASGLQGLWVTDCCSRTVGHSKAFRCCFVMSVNDFVREPNEALNPALLYAANEIDVKQGFNISKFRCGLDCY